MMIERSTNITVLKGTTWAVVVRGVIFVVLLSSSAPVTQAKGDDFGDVVKLIEQFDARVAGGPKRQLAGSTTWRCVCESAGCKRQTAQTRSQLETRVLPDRDWRKRSQRGERFKGAVVNNRTPV
jgi:hypothetical protein